MNQQESLYLHDVTVLLKESVDLLEISSPWRESRKWFARLFRVKQSAAKLQPPLYLGEREELRSLYLSIDMVDKRMKENLFKCLSKSIQIPGPTIYKVAIPKGKKKGARL